MPSNADYNMDDHTARSSAASNASAKSSGRSATAIGSPAPAAPPAGSGWPSPPFASYPGPTAAQPSSTACVIEGLSGRIERGTLAAFVAGDRIAHVLQAASNTPIPLRFDQFRSLTLTEPLAPARPQAAALSNAAAVLEKRLRTSYRLQYKGGHAMSGQTIGYLENALGLFLFPPVDERDRVLRMFVPREAIERYEFGAPIGKVLVEQRAATQEQVEEAVTLQEQMRTQKLGELLVKQEIVTPADLLKALDMQSRMLMMRVGEALIAIGLIQQEQLDAVLEEQKSDRSQPLGELLVRQKLITRSDLRLALAHKMGYPIVDPGQ